MFEGVCVCVVVTDAVAVLLVVGVSLGDDVAVRLAVCDAVILAV